MSPLFSPWTRGSVAPLKVHAGALDVVAAPAIGARPSAVAATSTPIGHERTRNASSQLLTRVSDHFDPLLDNVAGRRLMAARPYLTDVAEV